MRAYLLIGVFLLSCLLLTAQTPTSFGVKTGLALSLHYGPKGDPADMSVSLGMRSGIYAGGWMDFHILPHFALGYEILYVQKGSREEITIYRMENEFGEMEQLARPALINVKYYMDYLEMPVLFKIKAINQPKWTLGLVAGTAMGIRINGDHELVGRVYIPDGDDFEEVIVNDSSNLEYANMFDFSFVTGGNLALKSKLPLELEYRITFGWDYLEMPTFEGFAPATLRNQSYYLGLNWRF